MSVDLLLPPLGGDVGRISPTPYAASPHAPPSRPSTNRGPGSESSPERGSRPAGAPSKAHPRQTPVTSPHTASAPAADSTSTRAHSPTAGSAAGDGRGGGGGRSGRGSSKRGGKSPAHHPSTWLPSVGCVCVCSLCGQRVYRESARGHGWVAVPHPQRANRGPKQSSR